jgi:hypothetical protein
MVLEMVLRRMKPRPDSAKSDKEADRSSASISVTQFRDRLGSQVDVARLFSGHVASLSRITTQ